MKNLKKLDIFGFKNDEFDKWLERKTTKIFKRSLKKRSSKVDLRTFEMASKPASGKRQRQLQID